MNRLPVEKQLRLCFTTSEFPLLSNPSFIFMGYKWEVWKRRHTAVPEDRKLNSLWRKRRVQVMDLKPWDDFHPWDFAYIVDSLRMCGDLGLHKGFFDIVFLLENWFMGLLFGRSVPNCINPWMGLGHVKYVFRKGIGYCTGLHFGFQPPAFESSSCIQASNLVLLFCFVFLLVSKG